MTEGPGVLVPLYPLAQTEPRRRKRLQRRRARNGLRQTNRSRTGILVSLELPQCSGPEGTVLQGYLSPVLFHPSSGSDLSSLPPRLGPEDIQFFLVSRMEVAEWERSPEAAPVLPFPGQLEQGMALVPSQERCLELTLEWPFPGHQKDGMAVVPPWESISWRVAQTL